MGAVCFSITKLTYAQKNRTRRPTSGLRPAYVPGTPTLGHSITRLRALRAVAPTLLPGLCNFFGRKGSRPAGYLITGSPPGPVVFVTARRRCGAYPLPVPLPLTYRYRALVKKTSVSLSISRITMPPQSYPPHLSRLSPHTSHPNIHPQNLGKSTVRTETSSVVRIAPVYARIRYSTPCIHIESFDVGCYSHPSYREIDFWPYMLLPPIIYMGGS